MQLADTIRTIFANNEPWIGFDLDATLAKYKEGQDNNVIGKLIDGEATKLLKQYIKEGKRCKIVTARVGHGSDKEIAKQIKLIEKWTIKHFGVKLPVVSGKDPNMIMLFDDRATGVEENTGKIL